MSDATPTTTPAPNPIPEEAAPGIGDIVETQPAAIERGDYSMNPDTLEQLRDWFRTDSKRMTMMGARKFGVPEGHVIAALVGEWPITELRAVDFPSIMDALKGVGEVRIFVRSRVAVMEVNGNLGEAKFSRTGPFFNVDGGGLDMHIMQGEIARAYAVEKKSHMDAKDHTRSIQFYDREGNAGFKVFLWEGFPNTPGWAVERFNELVRSFSIG